VINNVDATGVNAAAGQPIEALARKPPLISP
jgi:hypothetical protein